MSVLMISQAILTKCIAVGAICSMGVGYAVYGARTGNVKEEAVQQNALVMKAGMFSASSVSSNADMITDSSSGDGGDGDGDGSGSDSVSLMGSTGSYRYSRVGKAYE